MLLVQPYLDIKILCHSNIVCPKISSMHDLLKCLKFINTSGFKRCTFKVWKKSQDFHCETSPLAWFQFTTKDEKSTGNVLCNRHVKVEKLCQVLWFPNGSKCLIFPLIILNLIFFRIIFPCENYKWIFPLSPILIVLLVYFY